MTEHRRTPADDARDDARLQLDQAVAALADAEQHVADAVNHARSLRVPWSTIADALGVTKQAAHQRYRTRRRTR